MFKLIGDTIGSTYEVVVKNNVNMAKSLISEVVTSVIIGDSPVSAIKELINNDFANNNIKRVIMTFGEEEINTDIYTNYFSLKPEFNLVETKAGNILLFHDNILQKDELAKSMNNRVEHFINRNQYNTNTVGNQVTITCIQ